MEMLEGSAVLVVELSEVAGAGRILEPPAVGARRPGGDAPRSTPGGVFGLREASASWRAVGVGPRRARVEAIAISPPAQPPVVIYTSLPVALCARGW